MLNEAFFEGSPAPLNQPEFQAAVHAAQIKALYHAPAIMLVNPINASFLAVVLWPAYPAWILLLWIGLFCAVASVRFIDRARYLRQPDEIGREVSWARRFNVGAAATGFLWGLAASVVFVSPDPLAHVVVVFVVGGMTLGAVSQQSAYLPAFFSFALPATVPQVVCYLAKGDRVSISMALMLAVYVVVVALMGRYINRVIVESIRLRLGQTAANSELQAAIAESKAVLMAWQQSEERFHTIFDSVNDLIFVHDFETGTFIEVNRSACEILGYTRDELLKLNIGDISENKPPYTSKNLLSEMQKARSGTPETFEWRGKTKDGRLFWVEISIRRAAFGGRDFLLATAREISRRKEAESQLKRMAQFDLLTGLANRGVFVAEVARAIESTRRGGRGFAVLYLDLDHFKDVNDTLGHPIGDRLLQSVAERLQANVRAIDTLARFGGDEFALLMADIGDPTDAGVLADKLLQIMLEPFLLDGNQIQSGVSIGIATYEPDDPGAEALLAHADVALYRAKSEGRHTYRFFTSAMDAEVRKRVALTSELQAGIAAGQLFLAYQPQVDMETSRLVGLEALVRWNHPTLGVLLPAEFLPAAERSGLIVMLGNWVLRSACRQAKQWLDTGVALPLLAVNVSALQFKAPRELENEIEAVLAETGFPPGLLEIEMTESALMGTSGGHDSVVERLRARGLRIAIDDFGTGYSSLLYLRRFPVDRIKIAQEFVKDIGVDANDTAIVKASIGLARELGIGVIAEGVETADQVRLLHAVGMPTSTGLLLCRANGAGRCSAAPAQRQRHAWLVGESHQSRRSGGRQATTRPSRSQKQRVALNPKRTHSPGVATPGRPVCFSRSACCSLHGRRRGRGLFPDTRTQICIVSTAAMHIPLPQRVIRDRVSQQQVQPCPLCPESDRQLSKDRVSRRANCRHRLPPRRYAERVGSRGSRKVIAQRL